MMPEGRIRIAMAKGFAAFLRNTNLGQRIFLAVILLWLGAVVVAAISDEVVQYKFTHLSAQEHLRLARAACEISSGQDARECQNTSEAVRQLTAIPRAAEEYSIASDFLASVQLKVASDDAAWQKKIAQNQEQAYQQYQSNIRGEAHDAFKCSMSTVNTQIMSFDAGGHWWNDDGRCEEQLQRIKEQQQRRRDSDAELNSYWSTTLRVNTDMDSFWLPGEERTCQTYPDDKGRVATVACTSTGTHQDHNIPVKFWGCVDRNTTSDWKCRREGDEFICLLLSELFGVIVCNYLA